MSSTVRAGPVPDAYVAYHRQGELGPWTLVERISYKATAPALARADGSGMVTIPGAWVLHWPVPIHMPPSIWVDAVYSPSLHNGFVTVADRRFLRPGGPVAVVGPRRVRVQLVDASGDPPQWLFTIGRLDDLVRDFERSPRERGDVERQLLNEYEAFLQRHADTPRPPTQEPRWDPWHTEEDKRKWRETVAQDHERFPTWGAYARDRHGVALEHYRRNTQPPSPWGATRGPAASHGPAPAALQTATAGTTWATAEATAPRPAGLFRAQGQKPTGTPGDFRRVSEARGG